MKYRTADYNSDCSQTGRMPANAALRSSTMSAILSITAPSFMLIGLGYVSVMTGLISRDTTRGMGIFVITIALPALIVRGMANRSLSESMDLDFLAGYGLASL